MCVGRGAQNRGFGVKIQKYGIPWVQNELLWVPHAFLNYFGALGAHGGPFLINCGVEPQKSPKIGSKIPRNIPIWMSRAAGAYLELLLVQVVLEIGPHGPRPMGPRPWAQGPGPKAQGPTMGP